MHPIRQLLATIALTVITLAGLLLTGAGPATASQGLVVGTSTPTVLYRPADSGSDCGNVFQINRISPSRVQIYISKWDIQAIIGTGYGTIDAFSNSVYLGGFSISSYAGKTFDIPASPGQMVELVIKRGGYEYCRGDYFV